MIDPPEAAVRLPSRPDRGRRDFVWGIICDQAAKGKISMDNFRAAVKIRAMCEKEGYTWTAS